MNAEAIIYNLPNMLVNRAKDIAEIRPIHLSNLSARPLTPHAIRTTRKLSTERDRCIKVNKLLIRRHRELFLYNIGDDVQTTPTTGTAHPI